MARLFHVRDRDLQSSTFTGNPDFDQEDGNDLLQEDDATKLEWDGSASWQVHIIHVPPEQSVFHVAVGQIYSATVQEEAILVTEDDTELVDETGGAFLAEMGQSWPTPLIHV